MKIPFLFRDAPSQVSQGHGCGAGVAVAGRLSAARKGRRTAEASRTNMVCICTSLGLHAPFLFPNETGADYKLTPYLEILKDHRRDFTLFSGLSHPDQTGANGHTSEMTWLTSARFPGLGGFKNTVSLDQLAAETIGLETRLPVVGAGHRHAEPFVHARRRDDPRREPPFARVRQALPRRHAGRGEAAGAQAPRGAKHHGRGARRGAKVSRNASARPTGRSSTSISPPFANSRSGSSSPRPGRRSPSPGSTQKPPTDINNGTDLIGRMQLLFDLIPLALQTDSTRLVTILLQGANSVPPVPGVTIDHHNLSHHGRDPAKIEQLRLIEEAQMRVCSRFARQAQDQE